MTGPCLSCRLQVVYEMFHSQVEVRNSVTLSPGAITTSLTSYKSDAMVGHVLGALEFSAYRQPSRCIGPHDDAAAISGSVTGYEGALLQDSNTDAGSVEHCVKTPHGCTPPPPPSTPIHYHSNLKYGVRGCVVFLRAHCSYFHIHVFHNNSALIKRLFKKH